MASLTEGAQIAEIKHKTGITKIGQDRPTAGIVCRANRTNAKAKYAAAKYLSGRRNE
jgi:hypothetical protein